MVAAQGVSVVATCWRAKRPQAVKVGSLPFSYRAKSTYSVRQMNHAPDPDTDEDFFLSSPYDSEDTEEEDLWFLPPSADPDQSSQSHMPWPVAARETSMAQEVWHRAEAAQYRPLLDAAQAVARYSERLRLASDGVDERIALLTVSALLRGEGIWLGPEDIALYRAFRLGSDDRARDLSRADWAVRRLTGNLQPNEDLRAFLGRVSVNDPMPGEDHPVGDELDLLGESWVNGVLPDVHPLSIAAHGFAQWRKMGLTTYDQLLEPSVAALKIGAGQSTPFLPMAEGHRFDRHRLEKQASGAEARLVTFYAAAEAGALRAAMELERLAGWKTRAEAETADLSGRTPPLLIETFIRYPIVSAELLADAVGCSRPAARRNLAIFSDRGLIRELTGQERYRFWAAHL